MPDDARAWLRRLEWGAALLLAVLFVARGLVPGLRQLNTDFPNYYTAARVYLAGLPFERVYDWVWFQRQKDHLGLDWGVVSYGPLTPFSALVLAPIAWLPALAAKRCWLALNVLLLGAVIGLLSRVTKLGVRRVVLLAFLTVIPLRTSFDFGQQHLLVLFLATLALVALTRGYERTCGALVALAAVLKLYPALFALFFVLRRRWGALASCCVTAVASLVGGAALFGLAPLRAYATYVLPRVSAGEVHDPYYVGQSSLTVVLRHLFTREPALNPQPLADAPVAYALLQPTLQALLLTSAVWLLSRRRAAPDALVWGSLGALALVLSGAPATYHFCLLILSTAVTVDALLSLGRTRAALAVTLLHALVSAPLYRLVPEPPESWEVPRVYALLAYWGVTLWALSTSGRAPEKPDHRALALALGTLLAGSGIASTWRHLAGLNETYAARLPVPARDSLLVTAPAVGSDRVYFSRLDDEGYSLATPQRTLVPAARGLDVFHPAVARDTGEVWAEVAGRTSRIVRLGAGGELTTEAEGEEPSVSRDGRWLGFLREDGTGRGLWVLDRHTRKVTRVAPADADVLDFSIGDDGACALTMGGRLFLASVDGDLTPLGVEGRTPVVSQDRRRLAFSKPEHGAWQLAALDLSTHEIRTLTHADCNALTPAWGAEDARLVYATDCGRGLGATALSSLVVPP